MINKQLKQGKLPQRLGEKIHKFHENKFESCLFHTVFILLVDLLFVLNKERVYFEEQETKA